MSEAFLKTVTAKITRAFTSNGLDTIYLEKDKKVAVPEHLAKFLIDAGYAIISNA